MTRKPLFAALACALLVAPTAQAADLEGCALVAEDFDMLVVPALVGTWIVQNGAGQMVGKHDGQMMTMALPPAEPAPLEFLVQDGVLNADLKDFGIAPVTMLDPAHPHPEVKVDGVGLTMDIAALGEAPDCAAQDMMRILFSGTLENADIGGTLNAFFGLYVINENQLSGVLDMSGTMDGGGEMTVRRLITATRQN